MSADSPRLLGAHPDGVSEVWWTARGLRVVPALRDRDPVPRKRALVAVRGAELRGACPSCGARGEVWPDAPGRLTYPHVAPCHVVALLSGGAT